MFSADAGQWAEDSFAHADLGDSRRTKRLVNIASSLANQAGLSLVQSLQSPADIEAACRFIRNQAIDASAIAEAGFAATAKRVKNYKTTMGGLIQTPNPPRRLLFGPVSSPIKCD